MNNIIIVGAGNMGRALARGLLGNSKNVIYFKTQDNSHNDISDFSEASFKSRVFFATHNDFFYTIQNPWVILAVKPYHICSVITDITDILEATNPKALMSVAAGVNIDMIKTVSPVGLPIIRTMPNISVATNQGVIGYITDSPKITADFLDLCTPLGLIYPLKSEAEFHLFTALAGSSPAFFLHLIEATAQAADMLGIDYAHAEKIAAQVFIGTASLIKTHQKTPKTLRESVTSPNGTTQAGLEILMNKNLSVKESHLTALLKQTLNASENKSKIIQDTLLKSTIVK